MRVLEGMPGETIYDAAQRAVASASSEGRYVLLCFNDVDVTVHPDSNPLDISIIYNLKLQILRIQRGISL